MNPCKLLLSFLVAMFFTAPFCLADEDVKTLSHSLIVSASMTKDFTIGRKTHSENGIFRFEERERLEHVGFNHPRIDGLAFDPRDSNVYYAAALNGVMGTRDGGETWRILTDWRMTEAKDVVVNPHNPEQVIAALPDGIAVSDNRGKKWEYRDAGIRRKYAQTIIVHREREGHFLAGTEKGIYLSQDGGEHWRLVVPAEATVTDIQQSPHDADNFAAVTQADGAWLSNDGGISWQRMEGVTEDKTLHRIAFDPHDFERMVIGGWGTAILVSEDSGQTWERRDSGLPSDKIWNLSMDPDFRDRIYANPYQDALYVSDDFGESWETFMFEGALLWDFEFVPID